MFHSIPSMPVSGSARFLERREPVAQVGCEGVELTGSEPFRHLPAKCGGSGAARRYRERSGHLLVRPAVAPGAPVLEL